jgi:hypothetical protein
MKTKPNYESAMCLALLFSLGTENAESAWSIVAGGILSAGWAIIAVLRLLGRDA